MRNYQAMIAITICIKLRVPKFLLTTTRNSCADRFSSLSVAMTTIARRQSVIGSELPSHIRRYKKSSHQPEIDIIENFSTQPKKKLQEIER